MGLPDVPVAAAARGQFGEASLGVDVEAVRAAPARSEGPAVDETEGGGADESPEPKYDSLRGAGGSCLPSV